MTLNEIRELLPFHVANSLNAAERQLVEDALKNSAQLRDELSLWQHARHATLLIAEARAENHLSSVQIVDFARGAISDFAARREIERHLQSCDECLKIHDVIGSLQPEASPNAQPERVRVKGFTSRFRLAYVIPALALILAALVLWLNREKEPEGQATKSSEEIVPTPQPPIEKKRTVAFTFPFAGAARYLGEKKAVLVLTLHNDVDSVRLEIPVQRSLITEHYSVTLTSPRQERSVYDSVEVNSRKGELDLLAMTLKSDALVQGVYRLHVKEVLKKEKKEFEPEEYVYRFEVRRKQ